ncbi:tRNA pseudouridine synthase 1 [Apophysomyces ossiformis]|uniref:tRNA pseudouridine synthase 1 n=1 Tax=Apophysomyces ossiformis TaxID=679940 RepID=A0A8H7EN44_9FUNG|nr:tRNA pseudouridine synthase 1 [Apophysomyces ossiformis]
MGAIWSKEAREGNQQPEASNNPSESLSNTQAGSKRERVEHQSSNAKRLKTAKQRKEFFQQNISWKAQTEKGEPAPRPEGPKAPRLPKKKVAMMIGFNGTGYQGMQINPNVKTIESELFDAMCKAGAISSDNSDDPKKVQWMRAARTDKGVHAAGNLVSLKIVVPGDDVVERINSFLPPQIRVWGMEEARKKKSLTDTIIPGYIPTMRSFHAKTACDSRVYEYLLPTYAFMPPANKELTEEPTLPTDLKLCSNSDGTVRYVSRSTPEELADKDAYRISADDLDNFKKALSMFVGTHNFHNYTIARKHTDKSANRFIISINVADPIYINGTEWLSVKLHGQSFMLHQIRKMISMALLSVRSKTPLSIIEKSFGPEKINIPKAPALGLLLERPVFAIYNKKADSNKDKKFRDPIDFDIHKSQIDAFKQEWIYSKIFETEKEERGFDAFLLSVDSHLGSDYKYLNPEGIIPEEAIIVTKYSASAETNDDDINEDAEENED